MKSRKSVRFDELSLHDFHLKQQEKQEKKSTGDAMTAGSMKDFRLFVEAFPRALNVKVELKRKRDFGSH